jgi:glycosyltransferase involved in cell wall biosynthesis
LYVGRFARVKNLLFLARVLKRLSADGVSLSCRFVGDGPTLEEVRKILADVQGVTFLGKADQSRVRSELGDADLLLLPSLTDICPNIVLEALATGLPCVVTSENGLSDGIKGLVELSPTDEEAWISEIHGLAGSGERYADLRSRIKLPAEQAVALHDAIMTI